MILAAGAATRATGSSPQVSFEVAPSATGPLGANLAPLPSAQWVQAPRRPKAKLSA